jgi:uncharacterized membrane protein (UPF0127 family)
MLGSHTKTHASEASGKFSGEFFSEDDLWRDRGILHMTGETRLEVSGGSFDVELADSILKKSWGLSRRSEGKMLFVFLRPGRPAIDMMLVPEPLHLYFLNEEKEVVDVQYAEPWTFDPRSWSIYRPDQDSKFLLESFEDLGLERGDEINFSL